jgi:hypothetical protein
MEWRWIECKRSLDDAGGQLMKNGGIIASDPNFRRRQDREDSDSGRLFARAHF